MQDNLLSGTIPNEVGKLIYMTALNVSGNGLFGTIPLSFNNLSQIGVLDLSNNAFTGPLQGRLNNSLLLSTLFVNNNYFTGPLVGLIHPNASALSIVDVSANLFSGSIPIDIIARNSITIFASVRNCLTGSLSSELCNAKELRTLALDGLHASSACTKDIYGRLTTSSPAPFVSQSSYVLSSTAIFGTIPVCIFRLPKLRLLHLSGNGLKDSFDALVASSNGSTTGCGLSTTLTDLSLSHNALFGSIPTCLQVRQWMNFDLSFNSLSGLLSDDLDQNLTGLLTVDSNNSAIMLSVNRLSGSIPVSIREVPTVSVLRGNIFSCSLNSLFSNYRNDLPQFDPDHESYSCGSNAIDGALIVFLCLTLISVGGFMLWKWSDSRGIWSAVLYPAATTSDILTQDPSIRRFLTLDRDLQRLVVALTAILLVVFMPCYITLSLLFSQLTEQYTYLLGCMYLTGATPAIVIFVLATILFVALKLNLYRYFSSSTLSSSAIATVSTTESPDQLNQSMGLITRRTEVNAWNWWIPASWSDLRVLSSLLFAWMTCWFLPVFCLGFASCLFTLIVNMGFVYAKSLHYSSHLISPTISFAVSVFKVVWNSQITLHYLPVTLHWLKGLTMHHMDIALDRCMQLNSNRMKFHDWKLSDDWFNRRILSILLFISVFSTVFAPYISSFFVNPNCFYYTVSTIPSVLATYSYERCLKYGETVNMGPSCIQFETEHKGTEYVPPFVYSYQCSSSLLDAFISVYIYRYIISGLIIPVAKAILTKIYRHVWMKCECQTKPSSSNWALGPFIDKRILYVLRLLLPQTSKIVVEYDCATSYNERGIDSNVKVAIELIPLSSLPPFREATVESVSVVDDVQSSQFVAGNPLHSTADNLFTKEVAKPLPLSQVSSAVAVVLDSRDRSKECSRLFSRETYILQLVGDFAVLLTFGLAFPPLAIVVGLSMFVHNAQLRWTLKSLLTRSIDASARALPESCTDTQRRDARTPEDVSRAELLIAFPTFCANECNYAMKYAHMVSPYLCALMMFFLSFSLFDTMADGDEDFAGIAILAVTVSTPLLAHLVQAFASHSNT
jgi:hypothetical protein